MRELYLLSFSAAEADWGGGGTVSGAATARMVKMGGFFCPGLHGEKRVLKIGAEELWVGKGVRVRVDSKLACIATAVGDDKPSGKTEMLQY